MLPQAELGLVADADHPRRWLGPSPLIDLEDPKLRLRVRSLTQLCKTEREKALAIYGFVKRLPLARRVKLTLRTDTFIYDAECMASARQRLKELGWEWGYGIHVSGAMVWNGYEDAFLGGVPTECDLMVVRDHGVFHDPRGFMRSGAYRRHFSPGHLLHWAILAPIVDWALRGLRNQVTHPLPTNSRLS